MKQSEASIPIETASSVLQRARIGVWSGFRQSATVRIIPCVLRRLPLDFSLKTSAIFYDLLYVFQHGTEERHTGCMSSQRDRRLVNICWDSWNNETWQVFFFLVFMCEVLGVHDHLGAFPPPLHFHVTSLNSHVQTVLCGRHTQRHDVKLRWPQKHSIVLEFLQ